MRVKSKQVLTHHVSQAPRQVVGVGRIEGLALRHHALQVLKQHRDAHACRREYSYGLESLARVISSAAQVQRYFYRAQKMVQKYLKCSC